MEASQASAAAMALSFQAHPSSREAQAFWMVGVIARVTCTIVVVPIGRTPESSDRKESLVEICKFLLDLYRRMSILTLVYINKYPYERLGGAQSVSVVLG